MKTKTFVNFLQMEHAKQYKWTDDEMPDAYIDWFEQLSFDEILEYAELAYSEGLWVEYIFRYN